MTLNEFVLKSLDVPFKEKGRDYIGWDCWAVVYCGFRDVLGIQLPAYVDDYTDPGNTKETRRELSELIALKKRRWEEVKEPRAMDVALFTLGGQPVHVGLVIDRKNFLHCEKKIGTVVEGLNSSAWKLRKEGIYRLVTA